MTQHVILTDTQRNRKIQASAKAWLKSKGYSDVTINCIRGTWHATNAGNYMMTAKYILEQSTGLEFRQLNASMARIAI